VDLTGDFFKAEAGVEGLPDGVLVEGFDFGDLHALVAEEVEGVLDEGAACALALICGIDGEVGNPTDGAVAVEAGGDVACDAVLVVEGDEDAIGLEAAVFGDGGEFSILPAGLIGAAELAEDFLHVAVDGDGAERGGGDLVEACEIGGMIGADAHDSSRQFVNPDIPELHPAGVAFRAVGLQRQDALLEEARVRIRVSNVHDFVAIEIDDDVRAIGANTHGVPIQRFADGVGFVAFR
jgi:hypothetical protein